MAGSIIIIIYYIDKKWKSIVNFQNPMAEELKTAVIITFSVAEKHIEHVFISI